VVDSFLVFSAHPERDLAPDVIHDGLDVGARLTGIHVQTNRFVSTGDIKPDSRGTHLIFIGNDSANRHGIPEVMVCHQRTVVRFLLTIEHLLHRVFKRFSPDWNSFDFNKRHGFSPFISY
jgi:hypothetical protein